MSRTIGIDKAYPVRGKDPSIGELRLLIEDRCGGRLTRKVLKVLEEDGGAKVGTTAGWFWGKIRRPQNATLEATGRANGYMRKWVPMNGKVKPWKGPAAKK